MQSIHIAIFSLCTVLHAERNQHEHLVVGITTTSPSSPRSQLSFRNNQQPQPESTQRPKPDARTNQLLLAANFTAGKRASLTAPLNGSAATDARLVLWFSGSPLGRDASAQSTLHGPLGSVPGGANGSFSGSAVRGSVDRAGEERLWSSRKGWDLL